MPVTASIRSRGPLLALGHCTRRPSTGECSHGRPKGGRLKRCRRRRRRRGPGQGYCEARTSFASRVEGYFWGARLGRSKKGSTYRLIAGGHSSRWSCGTFSEFLRSTCPIVPRSGRVRSGESFLGEEDLCLLTG